MTVSKWRRRFHHQAIKGLQDQQRPDRPRTRDAQRVAEALNTALQNPPATATHGSIRALAQHAGISKSTAHQWLQIVQLATHRHRNFKIST